MPYTIYTRLTTLLYGRSQHFYTGLLGDTVIILAIITYNTVEIGELFM